MTHGHNFDTLLAIVTNRGGNTPAADRREDKVDSQVSFIHYFAERQAAEPLEPAPQAVVTHDHL